MKSLKYKLKESRIAAKEKNTEKLKKHRHHLSLSLCLLLLLFETAPSTNEQWSSHLHS